MIVRTLRWVPAVALLLAAAPAAWAQAAYSIQEAEADPPREVAGPIAELLDHNAVQLLDAKGERLCEVWFRKEVPTTATPQQLKSGLTYQQVAETTLLAVMRVDKTMTDYRKQKIKPGVYTMRLGFQPMDGDHMGTAPYSEFLLVVPAADDKKPEPMKEAKELQELSTKATGGSHPGVFLLFPEKDPGAKARLANRGEGHWVLARHLEATAKGQKGPFIIGLALIGASSAA